MRISLFAIGLVTALVLGFSPVTAAPAQAESGISVDLVLPANLASDDAPFYQEAQVKIGSELIPVREGNLPAGVLVQYQPENKAIVVSDAKNSSEAEKGKALLDVVDAIQASTIAPAAGR